MDHLKIDYSAVAQMDIARQGVRLNKPISHRSVAAMERSVLEGANSRTPGGIGSLLNEIRGLTTAGAPMTASFVGGPASFGVPKSRSLDLTIGLGASFEFGALFFMNFGWG
jgi:hypothetical protein